jgi:Glycosyltransferase family 87
MTSVKHSKEKLWFTYIVFVSYVVSYILVYLRYTYFAGATVMRFPVDLLAMSPLANDLYLSAKYAIQTVHAGTIKGVDFVYSPLFVIIYSLFSYIDPTLMRWISTLSILISFLYLTIALPRKWKCDIWESPAAVLIIISGFLSYGMRFEIERGQWNVQSMLLCYAALAIKDTKNPWIKFLSYILFTISVHLKVWPLLFIIGYINLNEPIKTNAIRLMQICLINFFTLFVLGPKFLLEYFPKLKHSAGTPSVWIANISLYSFGQLAFKFYAIDMSISKLLIYIYMLLFFTSIIYALSNRIPGDNVLIICLCNCGVILFPTVSFDYKVILITICMPLFVATYEFVADQKFINLSKNKSYHIKINFDYTVEIIGLLLVLVPYPFTLYSYVYKADWGLIYASDTTPTILMSLGFMILLFLYSRKKLGKY